MKKALYVLLLGVLIMTPLGASEHISDESKESLKVSGEERESLKVSAAQVNLDDLFCVHKLPDELWAKNPHVIAKLLNDASGGLYSQDPHQEIKALKILCLLEGRWNWDAFFMLQQAVYNCATGQHAFEAKELFNALVERLACYVNVSRGNADHPFYAIICEKVHNLQRNYNAYAEGGRAPAFSTVNDTKSILLSHHIEQWTKPLGAAE